MRRPYLLVLGSALSVALPGVVTAAFNGSIDTMSGRPGDTITVTSLDTGPAVVGATGLYLLPAIASGRPERDVSCPDEAGAQFLGAFRQADSGMRVVFVVPAVAPGPYEVRMNVPNASPSCWRLWPFEVLPTIPSTDTARGADPTFPPAAWAALFAGSCLLLWRLRRPEGARATARSRGRP